MANIKFFFKNLGEFIKRMHWQMVTFFLLNAELSFYFLFLNRLNSQIFYSRNPFKIKLSFFKISSYQFDLYSISHAEFLSRMKAHQSIVCIIMTKIIIV